MASQVDFTIRFGSRLELPRPMQSRCQLELSAHVCTRAFVAKQADLEARDKTLAAVREETAKNAELAHVRL